MNNLLIYISKCILGSAIVFFLSWLLDYPDISWAIISVILVLTPDNNEALQLAITRIKANLIGGLVSMIILYFVVANPFTITIALVITILCCHLLNLMNGSRAALAAVIIIMLHGLEYGQPHFWTTTIERVAAVIAGCIIGLIVTLLFHKKFFKTISQRIRQEEG